MYRPEEVSGFQVGETLSRAWSIQGLETNEPIANQTDGLHRQQRLRRSLFIETDTMSSRHNSEHY
jgi:hypothetical protein